MTQETGAPYLTLSLTYFVLLVDSFTMCLSLLRYHSMYALQMTRLLSDDEPGVAHATELVSWIISVRDGEAKTNVFFHRN